MVVRPLKTGDIFDCFEIASLNWGRKKAKAWLDELHFSLSTTNITQKPKFYVCDGQFELLGFGGYAQSWMDEFNYNIIRINTSPYHLQKGVGVSIVNKCIDDIKNIPIAKIITLCTDKPAYYEKHWGFHITAEMPDNEYYMKLEIR